MNLIIPKTEQERKMEWPEALKLKLIEKNQLYLKNIPRKKIYRRDDHLWKVISSPKPLSEQHHYSVEEHAHGHYSQYISISSNQYVPNQIQECLPYLKSIAEKQPNVYQNEIYSISQRVPNSQAIEQWRQVCLDYAPRMELPQLVLFFLQTLAKGTQSVSFLAKLLKCKENPLLLSLLELRKFFTEKIPNCQTMSAQKNEQLTLESMSKTSKYIFCSICLIYDCPRHPVSSLAASHNYQYLPALTAPFRGSTLTADAISLFAQLYFIYSGNKDPSAQQSICSKNCFRLLQTETWRSLCSSRKNTSFSPIATMRIRMGVQIHSFNPCQIRHLFLKGQSLNSCQNVYYYLLKHYSITTKLEYKFHPNEQLHLTSEHTTNRVEVTKKKLRKNCKINKRRGEQEQNSSNSVCFHYFLNGEQEDVNCIECHCRSRGYCLPQCQCSDQCQIPLLGCKCRGLGGKCLDRCPCYKASRTCTPGLCLNCFSDKDCNSHCLNNQHSYSHNKLTRVGDSTIKGAGLGLFAGQQIAKDSFILRYTGQIVESHCLQKMRQDLSKNTMFFTFQLNKEEVLDSRVFGNKARFMNHSQDHQNVRPEVIKIREEDVLVFRALRQIQNGEELLFNYNGAGELNDFKEKYPFIK